MPPPESEPPAGPSPRPPVLRLAGVTKAFPGVLALRAAALEILPGEIHALVGENGAGKSTLLKIVTGALAPDAGTIEIAGSPLRGHDPLSARRAGIAAIYQELTLVPALSVRENLFLGRERTRLGGIDRAEERRRAREVLSRLGAEIDPEEPVGALSVSQQQIVEIARALLTEARLLVMDEPTAALAPREVERLFRILEDLSAAGVGVLFISHRLDEVQRIAHRITVLRDGITLGTWRAPEITRELLIERMVGRPLDQEFPKVTAAIGGELLTVRGLSGGLVREVSFSTRRGEVLGVAGLVGAGRTELTRLVFGADRPVAGEILLSGRPVDITSPRDAIRLGIGLLTEDRKRQGLILGLSARDNFSLPNLSHWSRSGWIRGRQEAGVFQRYVESLQIRLAGPQQRAGDLSGGNQQKLLLARWLESECQVLLFDEPTRGVDVGARHEIYLLINELAARGKAVVMVSSDLPELLGMSDRVLVMHGGRLTGEITNMAAASQARILELAIGGRP